ATFTYPSWQGKATCYKGTAIKVGDKGEAAVLFDRNQVRWCAGWTGGWLEHSDRRFALLNTPRPVGQVTFATGAGPGWCDTEGSWKTDSPGTSPLPPAWMRYEGLTVHGNRVVLALRFPGDGHIYEMPWVETKGEVTALSRTIQVNTGDRTLRTLVAELPSADV